MKFGSFETKELNEIKPFAGRAFIALEEREKVTSGGIIIPDNAEKTRSYRGVVVAINHHVDEETLEYLPSDIREGDTVFFNRFCAHNSITVNGKDLIAIDIDEIVAKLPSANES